MSGSAMRVSQTDTAQLRNVSQVASPVDVVALGRQSWHSYLAAQEVGFDQLMQVAAALLAGRYEVMRRLSINRPTGRPYITALRAWLKLNGFGAMPFKWRCDLTWCAENIALVERSREIWHRNHSKGEPSVNPRSMRLAAQKLRNEGPSARRVAPTVLSMRVSVLSSHLAQRFEAMPADQAIAEVSQLVDVLEVVVRRCSS